MLKRIESNLRYKDAQEQIKKYILEENLQFEECLDFVDAIASREEEKAWVYLDK